MFDKKNEPIVRKKLSHEVMERLLQQIESGELRPGSRLPSERELMEIYGVGRPAVREALQGLEKMGLVAITHGERARVTEITARDMLGQISRTAHCLFASSPSNLEHLREARRLFEVGMARLAAERATPEDIGRLESSMDEMADSRDDPERFMTADIAFHGQIAATSRNPLCVAVSETILTWLREFHSDMVRVQGREAATLDEHTQILQKIAAHDTEGAADAMSQHLIRANKVYRTPMLVQRRS